MALLLECHIEDDVPQGSHEEGERTLALVFFAKERRVRNRESIYYLFVHYSCVKQEKITLTFLMRYDVPSYETCQHVSLEMGERDTLTNQTRRWHAKSLIFTSLFSMQYKQS